MNFAKIDTDEADRLGDRRIHRFLSPHYDDVALSCGGSVALLASGEARPEIIVLFGAGPAPGAELTPFATENLRDWGLTAAEVVAARREEELKAADILGARASWLPFPDAIYRDGHYLNNEQLFAAPVAEEDELAIELANAVACADHDLAEIRIYAPLAIGGHVDHRLAFQAGVRLARAGAEVWFYEDLPYALRSGLVSVRLAAAGEAFAPAAIPIGTVWETKIAAVMAYPSQLARTFSFAGVGGSRAEIDEALSTYARTIGNGVLVERFWRLAG